MIRSLTQKEKAKVIWDCGNKTPRALMNTANIPLRTAERYASEFRLGGNAERKKYPARKKPAQTTAKVRKVIDKAKNRKRASSLRDMGRTANVSHMTAKRILQNHGFNRTILIFDAER